MAITTTKNETQYPCDLSQLDYSAVVFWLCLNNFIFPQSFFATLSDYHSSTGNGMYIYDITPSLLLF